MTTRTMTLSAARSAHPDAHIEIIDRADQAGRAGEAIYVWPTKEAAQNDDGARAVAIYWLAA